MADVVRLCSREDLEPGSARRFDVEGTRIALVRVHDDFYAVNDRCSHEDYSLSEGEVLQEECEIECWKHGSTFDLRTGAACSLPASKPVSVYQVKIEGDDVMVEIP
jgi:3-phenylpropionate/trans-cinnamate dioxygenase ferredoxin component